MSGQRTDTGVARVADEDLSSQRPPDASARTRRARLSGGGETVLSISECARCGVAFEQRRVDHRFCSPSAKRGERRPSDPPPPVDQVERLFDPRRDPGELVRPDDWFPEPGGAEWRSLFACETIETRRRWYRELADRGML